MSEIIVDTDVLSFLFKNHPIGRHYEAELGEFSSSPVEASQGAT